MNRQIGRPIPRLEDPPLLRGEARFLDDLDLAGQGHVAFLRSSHAHARILEIDSTEAAGMPGVLCVLTGATDALQVGCKPADAPAGGLALTDGVRKTAANYGTTFPYLTTPLTGNSNPVAAAGTTYP